MYRLNKFNLGVLCVCDTHDRNLVLIQGQFRWKIEEKK